MRTSRPITKDPRVLAITPDRSISFSYGLLQRPIQIFLFQNGLSFSHSTSFSFLFFPCSFVLFDLSLSPPPLFFFSSFSCFLSFLLLNCTKLLQLFLCCVPHFVSDINEILYSSVYRIRSQQNKVIVKKRKS